ncbi:MAG TPA: hypothetical protein VFF06_25830 [Polyangia bacterium]|nr:hypothetical protein [Polyangia bacterium]
MNSRRVGKAAKRKRRAAGERAAASTPPAPSAPASKWRRLIAPACAAAAVVVFLILKCYALHPHRADEGIYFYDATRLAAGARLYRDLFFAHPPLHLLLPSLLVRVFGYSFILLKALPQLFGAAQGVLAFLIARRALASDVAGAVAVVALLFAGDFLKSTCFATGINLADALLFAAVLAALHRRPLAAGILAGASVMTLLQTAPVALVAGVALAAVDRRAAIRYAAGLGGVVAIINIAGALYAGGAFFAQVYAYHLHKTGAAGAGVQQLGFVAADDLALFGGAAVGLALSATRFDERRERRRFVHALALAAFAQALAMATRPTVFPFYFQPMFLPLALALGYAVALGVERARGNLPQAARDTRNARLAGAAIAACAVFAPSLLSGPLTGVISPKRADQRASYTQTYQWKDAPLIGPLNAAVRALAWSGGVREAGSSPFGVTEYLWNQSRGFDAYDAIVDEVRRSPDGPLFGDSASTPLVALGAGRALAADFADTNVQRFTSGATPVEETLATLDARGAPSLVLASGSAGLFALPEFARWLAERYAPARDFADSDGNRYTLYRRR